MSREVLEAIAEQFHGISREVFTKEYQVVRVTLTPCVITEAPGGPPILTMSYDLEISDV